MCVCARAGRKKKSRTNLIFKGKGSSRPGKRKKFKQEKTSQFKSVKALAIAWRGCPIAGNFG